jgi:hypothetical protein
MIQQVDLRLICGRHDPHSGRQICDLFWRFVQSFNTTRRLKLKLDLLMDLVLADKAIKDVLLGSLSFGRLEQLELEGKYEPGTTTSMVLLADLLGCCPVVRDLRLKFSKVELPLAPMRSTVDKEEADDDVLQMLEHLNPSVRRWILANRGKNKLDKVGGHAKDIKLQHDDSYQVYGIPGLTSEHAFSCLQSLKRVRLDFGMDEPSCLGVKLAKFFAENAMVVQDLHVDACGQEMLEHLDPSVRRLMAANTDKKKLDKVGGHAKA